MGFLAELGLSVAGVSTVLILAFLFVLVLFLLAITLFFIKAVALFKMAQEKQIKNEWFSFVPILNLIILGKLADRQENRKGSYQKILPIFSVLVAILIIVSIIMLTVSFVSIIFAADAAVNQNVALSTILSFPFIESTACLLSLAGLLFVFKMLRVTAIGKVFCLFKAKNPVGMAIIIFFVPFLAPFLLLSVSKKQG